MSDFSDITPHSQCSNCKQFIACVCIQTGVSPNMEPVFLDFDFSLVFGIDFSKPPPLSFFKNNPPPQIPLNKRNSASNKYYNRFFKLKSKIVSIGSDIQFLKTCKKFNISPKFVQISVKADSWIGKKVLELSQKTWINLELKALYAKRNVLEIELYELHLLLTKSLTNPEFQDFLDKTNRMLEVIQHKNKAKISRQEQKLAKLQNNKSNKTKGIPNTVKNISNQTFTEKQLEILNRGLNFMLPPIKTPVQDLVFDVEAAVKYLPESDKFNIRKECKLAIQNRKDTKVNKSITADYKTIKELKTKNCFYIKADKSNTVVIMDKDEYINKVQDLLNNGPYIKLQNNPVFEKGKLNFQKQVTDSLKACKSLIPSDKFRLKLTTSNPTLPKLYCLPKIHKTGTPMRPIVSGIGSPTYLLSKWLVREFNRFPPPPSFSVKNTADFISSIQNYKLQKDEYLVSFDVSSLFPSIPIPETMDLLEDWLISNDEPEHVVREYLILTRLCMNQNAFQFNNQYFSQTFGTAMGNPLSPFLANLFMSHFETKAASLFSNFPKVFKRYVDDVFAVVSFTESELSEFIENLNSLYPSIKFTHEVENNGSLPFLDTLVIRKEDTFEFDIYRKPTQIDRFIDNTSFHSKQHKLAAFNSMVHRLLTFPLSPQRKANEIKYIKNVAKMNGFTEDIINGILRKQQFTALVKQSTTLQQASDPCRWAKLTYFPPLSNKIQNILSKFNIKAASYSPLRLKSLLGNPKDKTPTLEKSGIYEISCKGCDSVYIGQTVRKLETRFNEHLDAIRLYKPEKSAVAKHMLVNKHSCSIDNLKLVSSISDTRRIDAVETFFIFKEERPLMNLDQGPLRHSKIFEIFPNNSKNNISQY